MHKKVYIFVPIFLIFVVLFTVLTPTVAMSESVSQKVFRLHILANSDSKEDQELKLKVRNRVLEETEELYKNCNSVEDAIKATNENKDYIEDIAQKAVAYYGYNYNVGVEIGKNYFNTRQYDSFTLPAGQYNCLRIIIGEGKGHNWWCVMFPSVCVNGCTEDLSKALSDEEMEMVTSNGYIIRFKVVEVYENIKCKFIS